MLASGVVAGAIAGVLVARSWRPLAEIRLRWLPVLFAALLARALAPVAGDLALALYVLAIAGTALSAIANLHLFGASLVALGGILNLIVVVANGGMPFDLGAVVALGGVPPTDRLHVVLTDGSRLPFLADVIAVPIFRAAYSLGDMLIAAGGFLVPFVRSVGR